MFSQAFTSKSLSSHFNYELYETLGDVSANQIILWYMLKKFHNIFESDSQYHKDAVSIISQLKINYVQKKAFSEYANYLNFYDFIRVTDEERKDVNKCLEDTFEAFIGSIEMVINSEFKVQLGYDVTYSIISSILDKIDIKIDYESLYDIKTRLNVKLGEFKNELKIRYITRMDGNKYVSYIEVFDSKTNEIRFRTKKEYGDTAKNAERNVAKELINDTKTFDRLHLEYKDRIEEKIQKQLSRV